MKRYEIMLELDNGSERTIEVEGMSENDALTQLTNGNRFIKDLKTRRFINKDKIVSVDYKQEVKHATGS